MSKGYFKALEDEAKHLEEKHGMCIHKNCKAAPVYRFKWPNPETWPTPKESYVCASHAMKFVREAQAAGLVLTLHRINNKP